MRTLRLSSAAAAVLALGLQGCGGGAEPAPEAAAPTAQDIVVSGFVSKGPVDGATCTLYGPGSTALGTATTVRGTVSLSRSGVSLAAADAYYLQCVGGHYQDEATGQTVALGSLTGAALVDGQGRRAILTPLTQMAWDQAGGQVAQLAVAAESVAKAFGLQGVDILRTQPTDVNTKAAGDDAAGHYGIVLAALAQYAKDTGQGMLATTNTLRAALAGSDRLDPAQAVALKAAIDNLRNATQNANAAVRTNVAATVAADIGSKIIANTIQSGLLLPSSMAVSLSQGTVQLGSGQRATVTVRSTSPQPFAFISSDENVATVDAQGAITVVGVGTATITVRQAASSQFAATQADVALTVTRQTVPAAAFVGVNASKTVPFGDDGNFVAGASFSCASETGYAPAVTYHSSEERVATVDATGAVTTMGTGLATITASVAAVGTCSAQSVSYTVQVTAPPLPVITSHTLTSDTTVAGSLVSGGNAGTWTLRGTGLAGWKLGGVVQGPATPVSVDGVVCKSTGVVNAAGTEITGVDCTNVPTAESASSISIGLRDVAGDRTSYVVPMVPAPIPVLSITTNVPAVKLGATHGDATIEVQVISFSPGAHAWSMDGSGRFTSFNVDDKFYAYAPTRPFNMAEAATVGTTVVTVRQQAVPGMYAEAVKTVVLEVTDRDVPVGTFAGGNNRHVTLGADPIDVSATFTCAWPSGYSPEISYELPAEAEGIATLDAGKLGFSKAGTVVLTAKASGPIGTCDKGSAQLTVQIDKATPTLTLSEPPTVIPVGGEGTSSGASVSGLESA